MNHASVIPSTMPVLFVAWQDQRTNKYFPVGRLLRFANGDAPRYEFCYLRDAEKARQSGFTPFPAFPRFDEVYHSNDLFPLFENRLMPRSRPDFKTFIERLGLDPDKVDDFEILARSGGRRSTDSIELYPLPDVDRDGCYVTYFLVHGIQYLPANSIERILRLENDERLRLQWDMDNEADPLALSLRTEDRIVVGYLPRYLLGDAWQLLSGCEYRPTIRVVQVNLPPAPIQQRVLCRMEACWPENFRPYCGSTYQPIATNAIHLEC